MAHEWSDALRCWEWAREVAGQPPRSHADLVSHAKLKINETDCHPPDFPQPGNNLHRRPRNCRVHLVHGSMCVIMLWVSALLKAGLVVMVFPEGTSSDGQQVLPFFSSLLEPAVESACAVTPAFIRYEVADGVAADEVCYWRDMTFGPHFLNLLTKRAKFVRRFVSAR